MAEKIIVVKEKRRGCGCGTLILFAALAVVAWIYYANEDAARYIRENSNRPVVEDHGPPSKVALEIKIDQAVRKFLNDPGSYSPIDTKAAYCKDGFIFIHQFRARNAFNAIVKDQFGLIYSTNECKWAYCSGSDLPAYADEIVIDPKIWDKIK